MEVTGNLLHGKGKKWQENVDSTDAYDAVNADPTERGRVAEVIVTVTCGTVRGRSFLGFTECIIRK